MLASKGADMQRIDPLSLAILRQAQADIHELAARLERALDAAEQGHAPGEELRIIGAKARETGKSIKAVARLVAIRSL